MVNFRYKSKGNYVLCDGKTSFVIGSTAGDKTGTEIAEQVAEALNLVQGAAMIDPGLDWPVAFGEWTEVY